VIDRRSLVGGTPVMGPAIIEEETTTTIVPPWAKAEVDSDGLLILTLMED
jgi:N-methylhydantoinase A